MAKQTNAAERVTEIISLLRPARPRRLPESLTDAAATGDLPRLELFLERGASLEERSFGHASPLAAACSVGELDAARWLIAHGALLDPPGATTSPIQAALGKADCEAAAVLLDAGLPVERAAWGVVAAATLGKLDMLRWLLGRGLDLDAEYPGLGVLRERALRNAKKEGADDLVAFLKGESAPGPAPVAPPATPPFRKVLPRATDSETPALLEEALALVRAAGSAAAQWNALGPAAPSQRQSLLAFAAGTGSVAIVNALLDAGAAPDVAPGGTPPPLTAAAAGAEVESVRLLLARGASPNGLDGKSWLPLVAAAQAGDPEVVRVLLEAGANAKAKPAGGMKLVDQARGPYAPEIRALLEEAAATKAKRTPARKR